MDKKLPLRAKIAYSMGGFGEAMPLNLFNVYFVYFMTDVAGAPAALAGTIALIGVLWDAITDPIVGKLSDNCTSPMGRRRAYMCRAIIPLALFVIMLFTPVNFTGIAQMAYYVVAALGFWLTLTMWVIPFFAFGAEITTDYNERNTLRTVVMILENAILILCTSGPMWVLSWTLNHGGEEADAWKYTAWITGAILLITCAVCVYFTKGWDQPYQKSENVKTENLLVTFKELFKIRTFKILTISMMLALFGLLLISTNLVYVMNNLARLTPEEQSLFWIVFSVAIMVMLPFANKLCNSIGKREVLMGVAIIQVIVGIICFFMSLENRIAFYIYIVGLVHCNGCFVAHYVTLSYDSCEVDEFVNGKRREGSIVALMSFIQKAGGALAMWVAGLSLTFIGYDGMAAEQTPEVLSGLNTVITVIPTIFFILATIALYKYPVTKKNFAALQDALEKKKAGLAYSTEEFKELL
ncbi:MFS transporter [Anaerovoracaceae bacterium 41-7]